MRKILALLVLGMTALVIYGCADTLAYNSYDRKQTIKRNMQTELKIMGDDWDRFWMVDKPSRLAPQNM